MTEPRETRESIKSETERLVKSFLEGNERAFDKLVLLHKRFVFNLCYRMLGDYDLADDCAQEVFIKVNRSLAGFRFESGFRTWLYRVAVNMCKNRFRSREHRIGRRQIRLDAPDENNSSGVDIASHKQTPEVALERKEIGAMIQKAINCLPSEQRLVVVLRDMESRSYEEIVEITGFRLGTVKSKLSRGRLRLRRLLEGVI